MRKKSRKPNPKPPHQRGGRPFGSKNRPREMAPDSPYLTVDQYLEERGISETTFYRKHRDELETVKFGMALLITKASAAARDRHYTRPPRRPLVRGMNDDDGASP